ncbi:uncharacterized protein ISCGN_029970 [Ixodes scapularis]
MGQIPSVNKNKACLPSCFASFTNCRIILDCTEVEAAVPKEMKLQNILYSPYKRSTSLKGLVGVVPNGVVTSVSKLYPGSNTDRDIVKDCGVLKQLVPGDLVLADKGFLIRNFLPPGLRCGHRMATLGQRLSVNVLERCGGWAAVS